jgi:hypothetical protein
MSETKFCTGCQVTRPLEGGRIKQSGKIKRWQCKMCQDKKSFSPYAKGENNEQRNFTSVV